MTFACIIPAMFLSEFELAPNIVITSLFHLNTKNHQPHHTMRPLSVDKLNCKMVK